MNKTEYTLKLSIQDIETIVHLLSNAPWNVANPIIGELQRQVFAADLEKDSAATA